MGVAMGKEVASKMKEKCGDGTTTSILLLKALVQNGIKNISSGASPIHLKRGIEKAVSAIIEQIEKTAIPIKNDKETLSIATASTNLSTAVVSKPDPALPVKEEEPTLSTTRFAVNTSSREVFNLLDVIFTIT
jgi:chaperonin GroEL (HSP60 family)